MRKISIPRLTIIVLFFIISVVIWTALRSDGLNSSSINWDKDQLLSLPDRTKVCAQFVSATKATTSTKLTFELVNTTQSISQGLSGREGLGSDGMLFVFDRKGMPQFWMKEMKFDLDFVWLDQGRVVDLTVNVLAPDPTTPLKLLPTFTSRQPVEMVLELPADFVNRLNLEIGDSLEIMGQVKQ